MRNRKRARISLVVAIALAAAVAPAASVTAATPAVDWLSGVRDSTELGGAVAVSGQLRDSAGRAASGQAVLMVWPPQEVVSKMKVGDSIKMFPVGKTAVGADGHFSLRWDPAIPLSEFTSSFGTVDLEVLAEGPAGGSAYALSRSVAPAADGRMALAASGGAALSKAPSVALTLAPGLGTARGSNGVPAPAALDKVPPIYCINKLKVVYAPVWYLVAELYPGPDATVDFTYSTGTTASLGIGISASGSGLTFSQSGKVTVGSSGTVNFATVPKNQRRVEETQWRYGKWDVSCPLYPHFEARPHTWIGGSTYYNAASTPTANYCTTYRNGDKPEIDQHQAVEWSNGVKMDGIIGVDLSSTTGFTTKAAQKWTFTADGRLCGTNAYPFQARTTVGKG